MAHFDHYRTLLLDASYRPLRVISWTRAVSMDFDGKVYVVECYPEVIRSVSASMPLPAVAVLRRYVRQRPYRVTFSKRNVFARDQYRCQYCGKVFEKKHLTLDHVFPKCRGGKSTWENLVTACGPCNHRKGDHTPEEARMPLLSRPRKPGTFLAGHIPAIPPQWEAYLEGE